jgi:glucose-1-phosphatase
MGKPLDVKNLIFDLGGVILDLSVESTVDAFSRVSGIEKEEAVRIFRTSPGFDVYEKGMMTDVEFRDFVRQVYRVEVGDSEIDRCWNAMLLGIAMNKLELLLRLKKTYRVLLLSNTNNIHLRYINHVILKNLNGETDLDKYFHKAYYSQRMLKRKPEAEIFQQVLDENNLAPGETLFMDDNALNVESAAKLGIQTIFITSTNQILEIFND